MKLTSLFVSSTTCTSLFRNSLPEAFEVIEATSIASLHTPIISEKGKKGKTITIKIMHLSSLSSKAKTKYN